MSENLGLARQEIIPSVVSYSQERDSYVVGVEARDLGIKGRTNAHNFKMSVGLSPTEFSNDKRYWMDHGKPGTNLPRTYSCREITTIFLEQVLKRCIGRYERLMIGVPAIQDEVWLEHYRSHMRDVTRQIGFREDPAFLYEPFAVFQFYRHVEKLITEDNRSQVILLIDIGGGTCNTCIVKTTAEGKIALGNQAAKPFGPKAVDFGGKGVDIQLLAAALASRKHLRFKDNPVERAKNSLAALLRIEDAKIDLSTQLSGKNRTLYDEQTAIRFEKGELSPDATIDLEITSLHLEQAVRFAWTNHWLHVVTGTIREAEKLIGPIEDIDKVILCGGSGQLPFLQGFVAKSLIGKLRSHADVVVGTSPGFAVARGIQKECEIRAGKEPSLLANDLGRWALSSMYLGFRRNRVEEYAPVRVKDRGNNPFLLVPEWTKLDGQTLECDIELPFIPRDRLFFGLFDRPIGSDVEVIPLNVQQDTVRVPTATYRDTAKFIVKQSQEGALQCEIVLYKRVGKQGQLEERLKLPEFYPESLRVHTGKSLLGLDFGTCNTYLVELDLAEEARQTDYFTFRIKPRVKDYLADLQTKIARAKSQDLLAKERLVRDAFERRVDFVCNSVKIEGGELTKGETEEVLLESKQPSSTGQVEAKQLDEAYQWMLTNYEEFLNQPESFVRELNNKVLQNLKPGAGRYRTEGVTLSKRNGEYVPPDGPGVTAYMQQWANYVREGMKGRSPLEFAAALHSIFVRIHPFIDGNGRTARLIVNAFLLSQTLPVVVPTIDDRERYIDSIGETDYGNGDEFTLYLTELLQESLENLLNPATVVPGIVEPDVDVSLEDDDPLADVMGRLIERDRLPAKRIYEPWRVTFEGLKAEMDILVNQFNQKYDSDGYESKLLAYDILSEEKFSRVFLGLPTTKTWFFGLELRSRALRERFMFYFQHDLGAVIRADEGSIVLRLSRYDGDEYRNLTPDVFQPCDLSWQDGSILFNWPNEMHRNKPLRYQVRLLFAELIRAFLEQPGARSAA